MIATHGRGIWIVDDVTPLRKLTPDAMAQDVVFLEGRPTWQRLMANGGWVEGNAAFLGAECPRRCLDHVLPEEAAHFRRMRIEIFDDQGKLIDTLPANSRRGVAGFNGRCG